MIKKSGDLFSTDAVAIGHGVNTHGVMGAGIARAFKERYPLNYKHYRNLCDWSRLNPGQMCTSTWDDPNRVIYNIASQDKPGANARYDWLFEGCLAAAEGASWLEHDRIAIPMIGCGIGGLEWDKVETLLLAIEILVPTVEWEVWRL